MTPTERKILELLGWKHYVPLTKDYPIPIEGNFWYKASDNPSTLDLRPPPDLSDLNVLYQMSDEWLKANGYEWWDTDSCCLVAKIEYKEEDIDESLFNSGNAGNRAEARQRAWLAALEAEKE
jgi:hypothetical protein